MGFAWLPPTYSAGVMWYSARKNDEVYRQLNEINRENDEQVNRLRSNAKGLHLLVSATEEQKKTLAINPIINSYKTILTLHKVGDVVSTACFGVGTYLQNKDSKFNKYTGSSLGVAGILFAGGTHVAMAHILRKASDRENERKDLLVEMRTQQRIEMVREEVQQQSLTM